MAFVQMSEVVEWEDMKYQHFWGNTTKEQAEKIADDHIKKMRAWTTDIPAPLPKKKKSKKSKKQHTESQSAEGVAGVPSDAADPSASQNVGSSEAATPSAKLETMSVDYGGDADAEDSETAEEQMKDPWGAGKNDEWLSQETKQYKV